MNNNFHKLAIGGPFNGERFPHWHGEVVEYPDNVTYRQVSVQLGEATGVIYVISTMTDEEALKQLEEGYLDI